MAYNKQGIHTKKGIVKCNIHCKFSYFNEKVNFEVNAKA